MHVMKKVVGIIIFLTGLILAGCSDNSGTVVVYTTVDQVFSEPVLQRFEKETGIRVKAVFDTEETKSTGVLNRLIAEKNNPQCDVFWSGDPARSAVLKNKGLTEPYLSPSAAGIAPVYKDPENHWTGFSARARVLIFNKAMLSGEDVPRSIFDLSKPEYRGMVAIANPLFGTTTFQIAALFETVGDEKAGRFLTKLKNNKVVIATSNGDVKKRVVQGEVACGLTDTDDAFEAVKEGANIDYVFLDQKGIGNLIIPNTVSLVKNAPHAANGKKLIDYLLSTETEAMLAKSCAQMPLHKGVKTPDNIPSLDSIVPMRIDYGRTAEKLEAIQNYLKAWAKD